MKLELSRHDILLAIKDIDNNPNLLKGRQSSTYDLIHEGKRYPPILVLSVANTLQGNEELTLASFENNTDVAFNILKTNGFKVQQKNPNNKADYKKWASENLTIQSETQKQYISAIDNLSKIVGYNIFESSSIEQMNELYEDLIKEQRNEQGKYYNSQRPSVSLKGWYSASIKTYIDYLKVKSNQISENLSEPKLLVKAFSTNVENAGLNFESVLITRFIASLLTKPFVILTGLSGSGKTKLAQAFVQWICQEESQYRIIPVGADWTNREPLLGYPNGLDPKTYVTPDSGALHLILEASKEENQNKPYFMILDEMNLSHVERYFADFLSIMESGDSIKLYSGADRVDSDKNKIKQEIIWPKNLFIIGTVNIDETTYMFSPKVLDRANTIEFRLTEKDLADFIESDLKLDMGLLKAQGANMSDSFMAMASQETDKNLKPSEADLKLFFSELKKSGAEFGYRTASEIGRLMYMLKELGDDDDNLLDIAIMQKLLPKLHGSRNKLTKILPILGGFCLTDNSKIKEDYLDKFVSNNLTEVELKSDTNINFKVAFEKICRMYKNAVENGFASYAEA
jgi:5-methylcytosine-specific restriction protein B